MVGWGGMAVVGWCGVQSPFHVQPNYSVLCCVVVEVVTNILLGFVTIEINLDWYTGNAKLRNRPFFS